MSHFLKVIHKKGESRAKFGASTSSLEDVEETSKFIPEEKLRDEDLVINSFMVEFR
jgi:hypothetical protein